MKILISNPLPKHRLMKNLKQLACETLTHSECQQIEGGTSSSYTSFWYELGSMGKDVIQGIVVFSTEGGRNAGLSVK